MEVNGTGNLGLEALPTVGYFIGSFNVGGAERLLEDLTEALYRKRFTQTVTSQKVECF